ncbi:serine/threonine protein kinase [Alkalilimnicola ehrlichii]|uniref:serine/threonine protein kinase n=1 Tax=Alkalilimnicola ehrlichii TaxID=351052 RepID=UPI003BA0BDAD
MPANAHHPYASLSPDQVLDAVEALGFLPDGRFLALNSYENRVYQVGLEAAAPVVVKFYRPERWSDEAILEEHAWCEELVARDVPVVPPLRIQGRTLHRHEGFRLAVYRRRGGRAPALDDPEVRLWLGRFLARMHTVGEAGRFCHRPLIRGTGVAREHRDWLLAEGWIPAHLCEAYQGVTDHLLMLLEARFADAGNWRAIRLHGDCHAGNILWREGEGPHFVDMDDCVAGPAVQDLWMLISGDRPERTVQLSDLLEGYEQFRPFDRRELNLIEALRTLRIMAYAVWLARRWHDPAFPQAFPWFGADRYWEEHVLALREQVAAMEEPPLVV